MFSFYMKIDSPNLVGKPFRVLYPSPRGNSSLFKYLFLLSARNCIPSTAVIGYMISASKNTLVWIV